jgi:plastocyanin
VVTNGGVLRGQRASLTFDKAGEYNYICGLHPSMKASRSELTDKAGVTA